MKELGVPASDWAQHALGSSNARGWLLQFDALLNPVGVPGSFGWDVSPSVIPATMVPSYSGPSTYLLAGAFNCGKGQPGQVAAVSHGAPAAVFEGVRVLNTAEEAGR